MSSWTRDRSICDFNAGRTALLSVSSNASLAPKGFVERFLIAQRDQAILVGFGARMAPADLTQACFGRPQRDPGAIVGLTPEELRNSRRC